MQRSGASGEIRTPDLLVRSKRFAPSLYGRPEALPFHPLGPISDLCCSYAPAIGDYGAMEIPLGGVREKAALAITAFAIAAIIIFQASEVWLADYRIHSKNIELMERGTALMPSDGQAWDLLGHYYQWDFLHSDLPRALADYWIDVARASETKGDVAGARQAFERAQAVYPASRGVDFYYGNFLLRQQEYPAAYDELRRVTSSSEGSMRDWATISLRGRSASRRLAATRSRSERAAMPAS